MAQLTAAHLLVFCTSPGLIRGGQRNPAIASYPLDFFTAGQLDELARDPDIRLGIGHLLNVDEVAERVAMQIAVDERDRDALAVRELGGHTFIPGEPGAPAERPLVPENVESADGKPVPVQAGDASEAGTKSRRQAR